MVSLYAPMWKGANMPVEPDLVKRLQQCALHIGHNKKGTVLVREKSGETFVLVTPYRYKQSQKNYRSFR